MRNIRHIIWHEIVTMLGRRSFWLMTFIFPGLILALTTLPGLQARGASGNAQVQQVLAESLAAPIAYVDLIGALDRLPPDVPPAAIQILRDEDAARRALAAREITGYYLIGPEYLSQGRVIVVIGRGGMLAATNQEQLLRYLLSYALTGEQQMALLLTDPVTEVEVAARSPEVKPSAGDRGGLGLQFVVMFVLFFVITISAGYMLQSVTREKESRTVEVLLTSLRPREVMLGKVVGLGAVALLQMGVWLGGGALMLRQGSPVVRLMAGQVLQPGFIALAVAYFLLGYLLYASVLGAIGALAPTQREGAQYTFVLLLPLMLPFWLNQTFAVSPNGGLATFFSLFPLSAPTSMLARLSAAAAPAWQIALSFAGLAITTYLFVLLSARFFRADTLLSHASLNWGRIGQELRQLR